MDLGLIILEIFKIYRSNVKIIIMVNNKVLAAHNIFMTLAYTLS